MIVNQHNLNGIFTGFKTIFQKAFIKAEPLWEKVATKVPSETGEESYKWLGAVPQMREWIGERQIKNLEANDYTIKNKSFEATIGVPREDIDDDRYQVYVPMIETLGDRAAKHPDELVFKLLPEGFDKKCYDKQTFFSDKHKVGKNMYSNMSTKKLSIESYIEARNTIMSVLDEEGEPLKLIPNLLVVPPALEAEARKILLADLIDGTTNVMKGTAEPLIVSDLAGHDTKWFLLCTNMPIKPLIYQERKKPEFVSKTNATDGNVFFQKEYIYGVDSRENAGYGLWQMAYGSTGETV